jgi:hypothetical protein
LCVSALEQAPLLSSLFEHELVITAPTPLVESTARGHAS